MSDLKQEANNYKNLSEKPRISYNVVMNELHKPVMLSEVLEALNPKLGESYLDLTAGYAGHAGKVLAVTQNYKDSILVDRDENAVKYLREKYPLDESKLDILQMDFYSAAQHLIECGKTFDMILADFGVSSPQLDNSDRGFSFKNDGPLDMRMDRTQELSAETVINHFPEKKLVEIFQEYGEESIGLAKKHAREIVTNRPFSSTKELADRIAGNGWHKKHPATQVFQAVRIFVNDELSIIEKTLPLLPKLLKQNGRVAIITFHSLEDRLVKQYFKQESALGYESKLTILTKNPVIAGESELVINPRARSAKLRVAKRN